MSKTIISSAALAAAALLLGGCASPIPPGAERGPHGTMAYDVLVEASAPGAKIEVNGEQIGDAPVRIKIFGDTDGTFHDFGSEFYVVRALPVSTNQFAQTRYFRTGQFFTPQDHIPKKIYFDMNQQPPPQSAYPGPAYPGYGYPPPPSVYFGPSPYYYYGPPRYYSPGVRFHFHGHHRW
jgi:hypothetical protein